MRSWRRDAGIEFSILLDPEGEIFRRFGILNERHDKTVPHPTVVVVDGNGVARYVASDEDYRRRPPASEVTAAIDALGEPRSEPSE